MRTILNIFEFSKKNLIMYIYLHIGDKHYYKLLLLKFSLINKLHICHFIQTWLIKIHQSYIFMKDYEVPNKSARFLILFWDFFPPTWPYQDLNVYCFFRKNSHLLCFFYVINIKKIPPTRPILRPTPLLFFEKRSHLHGYQGPTLIRNSRVNDLYHGT